MHTIILLYIFVENDIIVANLLGFLTKRSIKSGEKAGKNATGKNTGEFDSMTSPSYPGRVFRVGDISVNNERAMRFTAVFAAIRLRAENIASLPKIIRKKGLDGSRIDANSHAIYKILKYKPNSFMNVFSFWEYLNACLDGWGNAYAIIQRKRNGDPSELIPIHPSYVTPLLRNGKKWYIVMSGGQFDNTYPDDDILHFFSLSNDGIKGVNPITYNSAAISAGISAQDFGNEFFAQGGNLKAVMETDKTMDAPSMTSFMEALNIATNHGTPLLDQGVKYKQIGIAPEAAQMLQTRTFAIQDIARIFNVPPPLLAELTRSTFSNIEHQDIQFAKYSIRPTVKRYETELECKLLFDDELGNYEIKFNMEGMLRGDTKTRAEFYHVAVQDGWLSRNEVRLLENMNPKEGLDDMLYPGNLLVVGKEENQNKDE